METEDLFLAPEDLYRLGNSTDPRLTHLRQPKDIDTVAINGIIVAVANGKGISLSTKSRMETTQMSGWVWKIGKGTPMPIGLRLINARPGHYSLCPVSNMPLDEFKGLLAKLALKCQKMSKQQVANG